jgi:outer membrane protein OmpA-like peptidoglycan-associated protein
LEDLGVNPKRVQVQGYGEAYPLAENASRRGREQNRRVEIVFSDEQGRLSPAR